MAGTFFFPSTHTSCQHVNVNFENWFKAISNTNFPAMCVCGNQIISMWGRREEEIDSFSFFGHRCCRTIVIDSVVFCNGISCNMHIYLFISIYISLLIVLFVVCDVFVFSVQYALCPRSFPKLEMEYFAGIVVPPLYANNVSPSILTDKFIHFSVFPLFVHLHKSVNKRMAHAPKPNV